MFFVTCIAFGIVFECNCFVLVFFVLVLLPMCVTVLMRRAFVSVCLCACKCIMRAFMHVLVSYVHRNVRLFL